ncbi:hypothetical protein DV495_002687 [Geotrichum candidum]|nr:hypothetical protein DV495_002687 [Geotrichum candidum]KAI9214387.1 hypothetical protein DS838_000765 [Geotrichum bryndzae]
MFREIPKDRITALLASFPKLTSSGTQHTTVEDNDVRYVYQPMEDLYLVLITNMQSNILQDIDTLHLLGQVVSSIVRQVDEREIINNSFEILSAFDEVISLGYRENLTLSQVKTFLEMDSHEEKIHEIIQRNKELEAAEERKLRAKQLELKNKGSSRRDFGSQPSFSSFGSNNVVPQHSTPSPSSYESEERPVKSLGSGSLRGKGLQLGKKKTGALHTLRGSLGSEAETALLMSNAASVHNSSNSIAQNGAKKADDEIENDGIHIAIKEEISAVVERMGNVKSAEVKGSLQLRIADPELTHIEILVTADGASNHYRTHPNVDKNAFLKNKVIKLKDPRRGFPANNQQLSVLRWQLSSNNVEEPLVPLEFHCWFVEADNGGVSAIIEYELIEGYDETLENVVVKIPLSHTVGEVSVTNEQDYEWNQYDDGLEWIIPSITPGTDSASGSFEWVVSGPVEEEDFFPMAIDFKVSQALSSFGKVDVSDVISASDESVSLPFKKDIIVGTDSFAIV